MADAEDLKSSGDFSSCGFDSHPGHQSFSLKMKKLWAAFFRVPLVCSTLQKNERIAAPGVRQPACNCSCRERKYLIAEPEKALPDWIYLDRQEGLPAPLDELQFHFLTPAKPRDYALRFPRTVSETVKDFLVEAAFPSQNPDDRRPRAGR
jgi:hypothetical protein